MADTILLQVNQWARFTLPYGWVLAFQGSGSLVAVVKGVTTRFGASNTRQTIGPFNYDADCDLSATGNLSYTRYNLADITQDDLDTLTSLPIGTEAAVIEGGVRSEHYWNGSEWVVEAGGGGDGTTITVGPTPPASPSVNDLWFDTN